MEKKSYISIAKSDSTSAVFSCIHDVYDKSIDVSPVKILILKILSYTFTATSSMGLGSGEEKFQVGDFISLLGLGKGDAVNDDTCHL